MNDSHIPISYIARVGDQIEEIIMSFYQFRVVFFAVSFIIITSYLTSNHALPWNSEDGMKFIVPRRMAKLLKKITKHNLDQDNVSYDVNIETTLKLMKLNGLRNREKPRSADNVNMTKEEIDSGWIRRRQKRSMKTNSMPPTCHSGKVYVNLTKYKNIIAPLGFHTHYCGSTYLLPVGKEPMIQILSQAIINALQSKKNYSTKVLKNPSCCAPKKVHDLYVLYTDSFGFSTIKAIPNVIASRCSCKND